MGPRNLKSILSMVYQFKYSVNNFALKRTCFFCEHSNIKFMCSKIFAVLEKCAHCAPHALHTPTREPWVHLQTLLMYASTEHIHTSGQSILFLFFTTIILFSGIVLHCNLYIIQMDKNKRKWTKIDSRKWNAAFWI